RLILHEVRNDTSGVFDTGEFVSRIGIPILNLASIENDGFLQVRPGDQILAEFIDNTTLQRIIASRSQPADTNIFILAGSKPFDFFVAPNPYNTRKGHNRFTLAAVANSGDMIVQHVEIYNLAGEKVRSISGEVLRFGGQTQIKRRQPAFAENWWDFRTDDGSQAAAGTYWAKFYVRLTDPDTGRTQDVTSLRKFVFIR
ncbi:MAG: hypothetical protein ONA90_07585, partial [candidate division KSB1 bacterium]|nr:hypothetical protein [candidate division KSB1 bacterium]